MSVLALIRTMFFSHKKLGEPSAPPVWFVVIGAG
jgi:hypothetical protein